MAVLIAMIVYIYGVYNTWAFFFTENPTEYNKIDENHEMNIRRIGEDDSKIGLRIFAFTMVLIIGSCAYFFIILPGIFEVNVFKSQ